MTVDGHMQTFYPVKVLKHMEMPTLLVCPVYKIWDVQYVTSCCANAPLTIPLNKEKGEKHT
jgi:hypothetical protein